MRLLFTILFFICFNSLASEGVDIVQYPKGHWGVEVKINEQLSYPFIIDTGAQGAIFPSALVKALGKDVNKLPEITLQGAVGTKQVKQMTVDSLTVGEQTVQNIQGVVLDLPMHQNGQTPGVLPYTFLNKFVPHFDLANKKLVLHPKDKTTAQMIADNTSYTRIPFTLIYGSFISFELTVNDKEISATLDSGAGDRIDANWAVANLVGIKQDDNVLKEGHTIAGAGGKALETKQYDDARLKVANIALANRSINFVDMPVLKLLHGDKPSANVGFGIFNNRQLIIDYDNQALLVSEATTQG